MTQRWLKLYYTDDAKSYLCLWPKVQEWQKVEQSLCPCNLGLPVAKVALHSNWPLFYFAIVQVSCLFLLFFQRFSKLHSLRRTGLHNCGVWGGPWSSFCQFLAARELKNCNLIIFIKYFFSGRPALGIRHLYFNN